VVPDAVSRPPEITVWTVAKRSCSVMRGVGDAMVESATVRPYACVCTTVRIDFRSARERNEYRCENFTGSRNAR
jgi:hypothetical protein